MHYYSSKRLKRLRDKERQLDRLLTKLETVERSGVELVLPEWMVRSLRHAGYKVGRRNHCRDGIYWWAVRWRQTDVRQQNENG